MTNDILIVDDEADICLLVEGLLNDEGLRTRKASNADQALNEIRARRPNLVILDIWLQGSQMDGLQLLDYIVKHHQDVPVIMISGHGNIETAVGAIKRGAYDFIEKPFKADRLVLQVRHALDTMRLRRENDELKTRTGSEMDLIGKSSAIAQVRQLIERVAPTGSRVMIVGPSGAGKEIVARNIHTLSKRADGPFVVVNCATLRSLQIEEELFGCEGNAKGEGRKIGLFEEAHGGTLYLDEVGDMPLETQGKIVRVLQEQIFTRVGGQAAVEVDVRVIASSNRDLQEEMQDGRIRQDLYYRLSVVPIVLPPLSKRRDDIPMLATYFLERAAEASGLPLRVLGEDALAALQVYMWPGNVRQLRNAMEWVLIMAPGETEDPVRADMLPPDVMAAAPSVLKWDKGGEIMSLPLRDAREMFERDYLLAQVTRFGGNISRTASFIGMERSALHRKLKLLGVHGGPSSSSQQGDEEPEAKAG
ncbi:MAG: sigma-54-dependent transcriptional regulator [Bdellovibrionales bacterium]